MGSHSRHGAAKSSREKTIYTHLDEIVTPNLTAASSSSLSTAGPGRVRNVAVQDICPLHLAEHLTMGSIDPVGYALVDDALTHDDPADPARVDRSVCTTTLMPGVTVLTAPANGLRDNAQVVLTLLTYPHVAAEPALPAYTPPHRSVPRRGGGSRLDD